MPKWSVRETIFENRVSLWARQRGVLTLKLNVRGRRGWPDRMYIKNGKLIFIEFKSRGEKVSPIQEYVIDQLRTEGMMIHIVDNEEEAYRVLEAFCGAAD